MLTSDRGDAAGWLGCVFHDGLTVRRGLSQALLGLHPETAHMRGRESSSLPAVGACHYMITLRAFALQIIASLHPLVT